MRAIRRALPAALCLMTLATRASSQTSDWVAGLINWPYGIWNISITPRADGGVNVQYKVSDTGGTYSRIAAIGADGSRILSLPLAEVHATAATPDRGYATAEWVWTGACLVRRYDADGSPSASWPAGGLSVPVTFYPSTGYNMAVAIDALGGVFLEVDEDRGNNATGAYLRRFLADGSVAPGWPATGKRIGMLNTTPPQLGANDGGGVVYFGTSLSSPPLPEVSSYDARGLADPAFNAGEPTNPWGPTFGLEGFFRAPQWWGLWARRSGTWQLAVLDADGGDRGSFPGSAGPTSAQTPPSAFVDAAGGGGYFADRSPVGVHLDPHGNLIPGWTGVVPGVPSNAVIGPDAGNGLYAAWVVGPPDGNGIAQIAYQHLDPAGAPLPGWESPRTYDVIAHDAASVWAVGADGGGHLVIVESVHQAGYDIIYLRHFTLSVADVPPDGPRSSLVLQIAGPNPVRGAVSLLATFAETGRAVLDVVDVQGRVVRHESLDGRPGSQRVDLRLDPSMPAGV